MKCLDHMDLAVMTGAVTVIGSAIFFFAYPAPEREPLVPAVPAPYASALQEELGRTIAEAQAIPARVTSERERAVTALGEAIRKIEQVKTKEAMLVPDLAGQALDARRGRRKFLERVFNPPGAWQSEEFLARERNAEAVYQQELGSWTVHRTLALMAEKGLAEEEYGHAVVATILASQREAMEPMASQATIAGATAAITRLTELAAPMPPADVRRDPAWGFGSIGDGVFIPLAVLGAGAFLTLIVGGGMLEHGFTTRTVEGHCKQIEDDVTVTFLVSDDTPYDVVRCSAFNGNAVTCDKACLEWPIAHAHAA
jgi:hypothetical protein